MLDASPQRPPTKGHHEIPFAPKYGTPNSMKMAGDLACIRHVFGMYSDVFGPKINNSGF